MRLLSCLRLRLCLTFRVCNFLVLFLLDWLAIRLQLLGSGKFESTFLILLQDAELTRLTCDLFESDQVLVLVGVRVLGLELLPDQLVGHSIVSVLLFFVEDCCE